MGDAAEAAAVEVETESAAYEAEEMEAEAATYAAEAAVRRQKRRKGRRCGLGWRRRCN